MSAHKVFVIVLAIIIGNAVADEKIVGGNETTIEEYPYAVSVRDTFYAGKYEKHICGGSVVSESWVLTSAHCVVGFRENWTNLAVRVGKPNNNQGKIHSLSDVVIHPRYYYNRVPMYNIGLLKVAIPFLYSIRIQPVMLAPPGYVIPSGACATLVGWGADQEGGSDFVFIRQVSVPVVSREECAEDFDDYEDFDGGEVITDFEFCAGPKEGGRGFCENDAGGPLVYDHTQVGVVSWSEGGGCAEKDLPGVYSNVSYFSAWISGVTGITLDGASSTSPSVSS
ncbi:trypsin-1-like [Bacillus rossius redtenbacheri]|uniref:trypsin-1-like n=1 Tax=Bacillus rossius redtenbacheri TaxID=93214 RepID=UPI002FDCDCD5